MREEKPKPKNQNKKWILIGIITLFVIGGFLFYWYEYRSSKARKECAGKRSSHYDTCLRERGINN